MKKIITLLFIATVLLVKAQTWQTKQVVRLQDANKSIKVVFYDSTYVYLQKSKISYIVNQTGSTYVQIGYQWDGSTSRIISFPYNSITQPEHKTSKSLTQILNSWL